MRVLSVNTKTPPYIVDNTKVRQVNFKGCDENIDPVYKYRLPQDYNRFTSLGRR